MKIIVNADDFGLDENRTRAISEAFERGIITTTTAMANMPWFEKAMKLAAAKGWLDKVGLHFNITEGFPLTNQMRECRELCNEQGEFTAIFHRSMRGRLWLSKVASAAIAAEAHAQMQKYLDCGGRMMHLDSHHHAHTDLSVARVLLPIAKRYGFKTCRMSRNLPREMPLTKKIYKWFYNHWARTIIPFNADYFTDFDGFTESYTTISPNTSVEIMTHPLYRNKGGNIDDEGIFMDYLMPIEEEMPFWIKLKRGGNL